RRGACSPAPSSRTLSAATSRMSSTRGNAPELRRRGNPHGQTPRAAGGEQLLGVDLVGPADEVLLRVVLGRAVDRAPLARLLPLQMVAALERRFALLARRAFEVSARHVPSLAVDRRVRRAE